MSRQIMSKATPDPYLKERARQIGTLGEAIRNLSVTLHDSNPEEWHQAVQPLIAKRLAEVSQRLKEMRHMQRLLQSFLATCHAQDQDTLCHVVDTLSGASS